METLINTRSDFFLAKTVNNALTYRPVFAQCPTCGQLFFDKMEVDLISSEVGECSSCENHRGESLIGEL